MKPGAEIVIERPAGSELYLQTDIHHNEYCSPGISFHIHP